MAGRVTPWASTPFSRTLIRLRRVPVGICGVSVRSAATGLATSEVLVTVTVELEVKVPSLLRTTSSGVLEALNWGLAGRVPQAAASLGCPSPFVVTEALL